MLVSDKKGDVTLKDTDSLFNAEDSDGSDDSTGILTPPQSPPQSPQEAMDRSDETEYNLMDLPNQSSLSVATEVR